MRRNDKLARRLIITFSILVFLVVASLHPLNKALGLNHQKLGFDVHVFAAANAIINTCVSLLLVLAYVFVRRGYYRAHRNAMFAAMGLSVLFLISYVTHHILAGDTRYGGSGWVRTVYFALLYTHILLAAVILPFILFSVYRGLTGQYALHKRLTRWAFPLWLYVSISGPVIYLMIAPYYL
ncbi:MAG: DUF420 domain-containing protein [Bacteroidetes bacterium]|nr:DUF420 domain-containing protein [Bacteroidota bacterium]MBS1630322.1 DUF420 domain-containing protein [Bacteroidota bacterium]